VGSLGVCSCLSDGNYGFISQEWSQIGVEGEISSYLPPGGRRGNFEPVEQEFGVFQSLQAGLAKGMIYRCLIQEWGSVDTPHPPLYGSGVATLSEDATPTPTHPTPIPITQATW